MVYQYKIVPSDQAETTKHVQETFNEYGSDGWELRCMTSKFFVFVREEDPIDSVEDV